MECVLRHLLLLLHSLFRQLLPLTQRKGMSRLVPSVALVLGSLLVIACFLAVVIVNPKQEPNFSVFVGEYVPQV